MKNKLVIEQVWEEGRYRYKVFDNNTLYMITNSKRVAEYARDKLREEYRRHKDADEVWTNKKSFSKSQSKEV